MLILRRNIGEGIVIGENIIVTVLAVRDGRVKLGIIAPKDVSILREELLNVPKTEIISGTQFLNEVFPGFAEWVERKSRHGSK